MNSMNPEMNAKDVCAMIRACGESGVTELSFGPLTIRFAPKPSVGESPSEPPKTEFHPPMYYRTTEEEQTQLLRDEVALKEERLAMALLEDPVEFEKLLAAGELEE